MVSEIITSTKRAHSTLAATSYPAPSSLPSKTYSNKETDTNTMPTTSMLVTNPPESPDPRNSTRMINTGQTKLSLPTHSPQPMVSLKPSLLCREYIVNGQIQMTDECISDTQLMVVVGIGAFCGSVCLLVLVKYIYNKLHGGRGSLCSHGAGGALSSLAGRRNATSNPEDQYSDMPPSYIEVTEEPPSYDWFLQQCKPASLPDCAQHALDATCPVTTSAHSPCSPPAFIYCESEFSSPNPSSGCLTMQSTELTSTSVILPPSRQLLQQSLNLPQKEYSTANVNEPIQTLQERTDLDNKICAESDRS